jgi:hypothetical protein
MANEMVARWKQQETKRVGLVQHTHYETVLDSAGPIHSHTDRRQKHRRVQTYTSTQLKQHCFRGSNKWYQKYATARKQEQGQIAREGN